MLNADLKQQLQQLLQLMEGDVEFRASIGSDDKSKELKDLLDEFSNELDETNPNYEKIAKKLQDNYKKVDIV